MDYRDAGVDIAAGRVFVERIRDSVQSTYRPGVLGALGGFGGCFQLPSGYEEPVLVSGTDGVGTKLKIARSLNRHDTVGIDLVAMCVNDVLTVGAEPLFFLDYLATGHLDPEPLSEVVAGIAQGCCQSGCALLGGETAEMPGFYPGGEYDLAGFCVGIVEKRDLLDGSRVEVGDAIVGLASRGLHSNGFSLVRKIVEDKGWDWSATPAVLGGKSLGEELLTPTQIYVKPVLEVLRSRLEIRGMAHITGGGLPENLPRCLNLGQSVKLYPQSWEIPPIFQWLAEQGNVSETAMFETFNMGIGFAVVVERDRADEAIAAFRDRGLVGYAIGTVTSAA
jgi:phosphoribosylformylglycinamidine cyclo-ligase